MRTDEPRAIHLADYVAPEFRIRTVHLDFALAPEATRVTARLEIARQTGSGPLVLAGETDRRPARALELLAQGYGRRVVLDVPTTAKLYEFTQIQLARKYVEDLPQGALVSVCPIDGLSTKDESKGAEKCIARDGAKSVLIVTSDFHTRRALSIFFHRQLKTIVMVRECRLR